MNKHNALVMVSISFAFLLAACSSNTVKLYKGPELPSSSVASLSDVCNSKCKSAVRTAYKEKFGEQLSHTLSYPVLQVIDGVSGPNDFPMNDSGGDILSKVYNDFWVGGYSIKVKPGEHLLGVKIQQSAAKNRTPYNIKIKLAAGHKYALGQVSKLESGFFSLNKSFLWFPFIYDVNNDNVMIYSDTPSGWLHH